MFFRRPWCAAGAAILLAVWLTGTAFFWGKVAGPAALPAYNPHNLIRLHVIANSDTVEDQNLKREVRDVVLAEASKKLSEVRNVEEARRWLAENLASLTLAAEKSLERRGRPYPVKAQWGDFAFPTRSYGELVLPAGSYEAVRLIIGEGKGENWWCVLFPPLCLVDVTEGSAAREVMAGPREPYPGQSYGEAGTLSTDRSIEGLYYEGNRVELRFKLLEVLKSSGRRLASLWAHTQF